MALSLPYTTDLDETLPHQVNLVWSNNAILLSCNCRATSYPNGAVAHDPIGPTVTIEDSRVLYNNPANHWKLFTSEDEAKW